MEADGAFCDGTPDNVPEGAPDGAADDGSDLDGDGVANTTDNCSDVANPGQYNEDGDRFGDACDPCPPFADGDPIDDPDADHVSGACDPRPLIAGDSLFMFDGFSGDALDLAWNVVGPWIVASGAATVNVIGGPPATITHPGPLAATETLFASALLAETPAPNPSSSIGVLTRKATNSDAAAECAVGQDELDGYVATVDPSVGIRMDKNFDFLPGGLYALSFHRTNDDYECFASSLDDEQSVEDSPFVLTPADPRMGVRVTGASAAYQWVLVVASP